MASEYFASLHYIWLNIVFFIFSLFLFAVCLYACLFVRWVYKRRLRQKTDAMIACYKNGEDKRKEMELNMKRQELHPLPGKKKTTAKNNNRKIHIVSRPCNEVIQKTDNEYIVRQVNEGANDEVACSPVLMPHRQAPPPPVQQLQTQYVMVPIEVLRTQIRNTRDHHSSIMPIVYSAQNQKMIVESVATQTSEQALNVAKEPEIWLPGDDGEKEEERIDVDEEPEESGSDKVMKRRNRKHKKNVPEEEKPAAVASDETRVSIESDAPPAAPASTAPTSSDSTTPSTTTSTTTTTTTSAPTSTDPAAEKKPEIGDKEPPKKEEKGKKPEEDSSVVKSNYYSMPGESLPQDSNAVPKPASRTSIFPYFVDSKAPEAETTTGKRVAKLTEPKSTLDHTDSSCALYRGKVKSKVPKSEKVYAGTPKKSHG